MIGPGAGFGGHPPRALPSRESCRVAYASDVLNSTHSADVALRLARHCVSGTAL